MFAVLAALLGALVTATITHYFAVQRENRRIEDEKNRERRREDRENRKEAEKERRELLGLLKLIHAEIVNNLEILKAMGTHSGGTLWHNNEKLKRGPDTLQAPKLRSLSWEQASPRIAALMENEERLRLIISGYAALDEFKNRLLRPETDGLDNEGYKEAVKKVTQHQWLSFNACQQETGMFWGWSKGMLVSAPEEDLGEAERAVKDG